MFRFFKKQSIKKAQQRYHDKLEAAMQAQRKGDIRNYSLLSVEADQLLKALEKIKNEYHESIQS